MSTRSFSIQQEKEDVIYPEKTLVSIFEETAEKFSDSVALKLNQVTMNYKTLNEKANQVAHFLQSKGVGRESIVCLLFDRSIDMIVAILGVLKAGGAYLPIDPDYPLDRIQNTIIDSKAAFVLTQNENGSNLNFESRYSVYVFDMEKEDIWSKSKSNLPPINQPRDLAYVIYTSGSTGKPKGVMIEHESVVRLLINSKNPFHFSHQDKWTMFHSYCFDFSVWEMYGALLYGGTVVIVSKQTTQDPHQFLNLLEKEKITVLNQTPGAFYNVMNEAMERNSSDLALRYIVFGGEALKPSMLTQWNNRYPDTKLINMYGITEITVHGTYKEITSSDMESSISNIGAPIPTLSMYVLNEQLEEVTQGEIGELYIAGVGVARGYIHRNELTRERFIESPQHENERLYKSGDLVRLLDSGEFEYIGRKDFQVKIRGHRVELKEIEYWFTQREEVINVTVVPKEDDMNVTYLCAYVEGDLDTEELRSELVKFFPSYMVPHFIVKVDKIPLTSNGKIDSKRLPNPLEQYKNETPYEKPSTSLEVKLVEAFEQLFNSQTIGVNDNFYNFGGDSLRAARLSGILKKSLNIAISIKDILANPTIKDLANLLTTKKMNELGSHSIKKAADKGFYEASPSQQNMYTLCNIVEGTHYNIPLLYELKGIVNEDRLYNAFEKLVGRHEALRTTFELKGESVRQVIHETVNLDFETLNIRRPVFEVAKENIKVFSLKDGPLFRGRLIYDDENQKQYLFLDLHHIICDGVTVNILMEDLFALLEGKHLETKLLQYRDYSEWQNTRLNANQLKLHKEYYSELFRDGIPKLNLKTDFTRPMYPTFTGDTIPFTISSKLAGEIKAIATETGTTMFMVLLAAFNVFLARHANEDDLVVGTPFTGRENPDSNDIAGMFVNTLPVRSQPSGHKLFKDYLLEIKSFIFSSIEHSDYQFEQMVQDLEIDRNAGYNPIFTTMFAMQNFEVRSFKNNSLEGIKQPLYTDCSHFDMLLYAYEEENDVRFEWEYSTDLFKESTIKRYITQFTQLLTNISSHVNENISTLSFLTSEDKEIILNHFNNTETDYPAHSNIVELFAELWKEKPNKTILMKDGIGMTAKELDEHSDSVAQYLLSRGVKEEQPVGIMMEKSFEMIVTALGILKAGAAYVPIDQDAPLQRINFIVQDCKLAYILTNISGVNTDIVSELIRYDEIRLADIKKYDLPIRKTNSLAYIIYTSGSTGQPKGVLIEDQNIIRLVKGVEYIDFSNHQNLLMTGSFSFDASTFEIWGSLLNGLTLTLLDKEKLLDAKEFARVIEDYQIDIMWLTSPLFNQLINENTSLFSHVKTLIVGGDVLSSQHICIAMKNSPNLQIINGYGPTENTTFSTTYTIKEEISSNISIGKPISNSTAYVVDLHTNELLPIGQIGELWVGGTGVARGYLNQDGLTNEKFIDNPFSAEGKVYKTGDLARWNDDGTLEFYGRIDNQVKIRGYRIELGEIESTIRKHDQVNEVVLNRISDDNEYALCAYYVSDMKLEEERIREYLAKRLPNYMVPKYVVRIDVMPLNKNGKIDKGRLPSPFMKKVKPNQLQELTETQTKLVGIWKSVLSDTVEFGIKDSFFEIGGHSLKAITLLAKINKEFNVNFSMKEIFRMQTVEDFSCGIERISENEKYHTIMPSAERAYYPVSPAQKRLFILNEIYPNKKVYNIPVYYKLNQPLNVELLEHCVNELMKRNEVLRTTFALENNEPVQMVHKDAKITVESKLLSSKQKDDYFANFIQEFDITKLPLFRVEYIEVDESEYYLLIDFHHIIIDGISIDYYLNELLNMYVGKDVPTLSIQYKDYSSWLSTEHVKESINKQSEYWLKQFEDEPTLLDLSTDKQRPVVPIFEGNTITFDIHRSIEKRLRELANGSKTTLFTVMFAAFNILLSKYTRQEDIIVGTTVSGRNHPDVDNMLGMFVNTLAIRSFPKKEKTFDQFLKETHDLLMKSYVNQDYPFEELIEKLEINRNLDRNPLYNVMFSMNNIASKKYKVDGLSLEPLKSSYPFSKIDLTMFMNESDDNLSFSIEYSTSLFNEETIRQLGSHYIHIVESIMQLDSFQLKDLKITTPAEEEKLLVEFNNTERDYSREKLIHQLFEEKVKELPDAVSLEGPSYVVTYQELNKRANQLAHFLRGNGTTSSNEYVAIMLDRSPNMVTSVLAILKAGLAYVPIDPSWPMERIKHIVRSLGVKEMITESHYVDSIQELGLNTTIVLSVSDSASVVEGVAYLNEIEQLPTTNLMPLNNSNSIAYVIFTSGSTGQPKGVTVKHKPVVNLIEWVNSTFSVGTSDKLLFVTSLCFDLSVYDILGILAAGGSIRIAGDSEVRDPQQLVKIVFEENITFWDSAPAALQQLTSYFPDHKIKTSLRLVFLSGDWIPITLPTKLKEVFKGIEVISLGGATEATIWSNYYPIKEVKKDWKSIPYGKPIKNAKYYILDSELSPCPIGVPGELYIGGECLASGYANAPELTSSRFITNPFVEGDYNVMYKTGDLARWLRDGNMEFLGRIDHQVKIRGYRIELGEIEYHLLNHPDINEAITVIKQDDLKNAYLCTYYTSSKNVSESDLKKYLSSKIPEYMVPSILYLLDEIPVTSNGKLDRGALPEPKRILSLDNYRAPKTNTEHLILDIWKELLKLDDIGVDDKFFEIGGNSLLLVQMHQRIESIFPGKVNVVDLFTYPTVSEIASILVDVESNTNNGDTPLDIDDVFEKLESGSIGLDQALEELLE
ncbi:non-ribosomal peptide synthetase [Peribacillus simplex]|uniref:non-ribosomal peptide synthetase n=1 Tax=Peribacillus simplex TaxID=1478 RepID=UPI0024C1FE88|nr:non-ribosomal peptide synthetase [Peribacillus simplex]WHY56138.1 amino acid adenylation domain-containing protein [Peribacillus simplex]